MANTTNRTTRIKHVFGNVLKLAIPLTLRTVTLEGGIVEVTDTDYTPSNHYPVVVQFVNGPLKYELDATIRDNYIAVVEDKGTIPVGNYAIVVLCKDDNGDPRRFKQRCVLEVVDVTADAGIEVGIEFEAQEWLLDGAIFLAIKGEDGIDGVGIESITTDETGVSGEYNQVTFHLTNGSSYTLNVRNGESTEQTLPANVVVDENYVHTDNNYTDTDKQKIESVDKLFADAEYDRISRRLNFFKHGDTMHTNPLKSIDITDFIRDSRVSSFRIVDGNLTIKLNSDGNNEEFKVPITSINANYYTKTQVDSLYSSLSSRVTPVEVIFTESNDSITSNRTINGIYTDYTNKKPIIGKYGSSVGVLLYISSQEAAFIFGDRYDKPFILRNSGSTHWGKEDLVDGSLSIEIDANPTVDSENAVSSGGVYNAIQNFVSAIKVNNETPKYPVDGLVSLTIDSGGYEPPVGGIPKSDLAQSVQDTLDDVSNKVDKVTGKGLSTEDYTTAEKQKLAGLSNYDDTEIQAEVDAKYEKPNTGIPKSDLASGVQASLGKADTALQSSDLEGYATTDDVDDAVAALVSSAPQTLDTLKELADALGDDPNFATTMATQLGNKVDKETGKGLSTNDYTTAEKTKLAGLENYDDSSLQTAIDGKVDKESGKSLMTDAEHTKLAGIAAGAEVNVQPNWTQTNTSADDYIKNKPDLSTFATKTELAGKQGVIDDLDAIRSGAAAGATAAQPADIPTKVSDLDNDSGFTSNAGTITGITMNGASKGTSGVVDLGTVITAHQDISGKANTADLATVATSGSYNDLSNKPTIPAAQVQSDWNATSGMGVILNKPTIPDTSTLATKTELNAKQDKINDLASIRINSGKGVADVSSNADGTVVYTLANGDTYTLDLNHEHPQYVESDDLATVATTGSYDDLVDKPTIPSGVTVDSTITQGGTNAVQGGAIYTALQGKANTSEMSVSTSGDQTTITLKSGTSATVINQHQSLSGRVQSSDVTTIVLLADEAAYTALATKDSGTLYLIPES